MLKLMRYMKPYILTVIVIFGLLFAQAMADLALPDYMSRIVNVGLQQGGLESPAPIVVRSIQMDHLQLLMLPATRLLSLSLMNCSIQPSSRPPTWQSTARIIRCCRRLPFITSSRSANPT